MEELKPCPFCGGEAKLFVTSNGVCVKCTEEFSMGCGCQTDWYEDVTAFGCDGWRKRESCAVEKAIFAWNRRADDV